MLPDLTRLDAVLIACLTIAFIPPMLWLVLKVADLLERRASRNSRA